MIPCFFAHCQFIFYFLRFLGGGALPQNKTHRKPKEEKARVCSFRLLPQMETRHNEHMPLKMKSKERSKFVMRARAEYARLSAKKEK